MDVVVNADRAIVGRMATYVAKQALLGHSVAVVNCEKALFSGRKEYVIQRYLQRRENTTPFKGPFLSRRPDFFVRRIIRGMLSHRQTRGREAFKRILCYQGIPEEFKNKTMVTVDYADLTNTNVWRYVSVLEVCKALGVKT